VFFFQAEDGIRDGHVTGVQTCALPISEGAKKLLAEAGVAPGTQLVFPFEGVNPFYNAIGVVAADQLKKVDLDLKLEPVEAGVLRSEERRVGKECRSRWTRGHAK